MESNKKDKVSNEKKKVRRRRWKLKFKSLLRKCWNSGRERKVRKRRKEKGKKKK